MKQGTRFFFLVVFAMVVFSFVSTACFAQPKPYEQPRPGETLLKKMETDCGGKHYTLYLYWYEPYGRIRVEALVDKKPLENFPNRFYGFQKEQMADIQAVIENKQGTDTLCVNRSLKKSNKRLDR